MYRALPAGACERVANTNLIDGLESVLVDVGNIDGAELVEEDFDGAREEVPVDDSAVDGARIGQVAAAVEYLRRVKRAVGSRDGPIQRAWKVRNRDARLVWIAEGAERKDRVYCDRIQYNTIPCRICVMSYSSTSCDCDSCFKYLSTSTVCAAMPALSVAGRRSKSQNKQESEDATSYLSRKQPGRSGIHSKAVFQAIRNRYSHSAEISMSPRTSGKVIRTTRKFGALKLVRNQNSCSMLEMYSNRYANTSMSFMQQPMLAALCPEKAVKSKKYTLLPMSKLQKFSEMTGRWPELHDISVACRCASTIR